MNFLSSSRTSGIRLRVTSFCQTTCPRDNKQPTHECKCIRPNPDHDDAPYCTCVTESCLVSIRCQDAQPHRRARRIGAAQCLHQSCAEDVLAVDCLDDIACLEFIRSKRWAVSRKLSLIRIILRWEWGKYKQKGKKRVRSARQSRKIEHTRLPTSVDPTTTWPFFSS